jgi:hypothetical protein
MDGPMTVRMRAPRVASALASLVAGCALLATLSCARDVGGAVALAAPISTIPPAVPDEICVGQFHTCARRGETIACWGDNSGHQIAASAQPQFDTPRLVSEFPAAAGLRCGAFETCALTAQGTVHCLGGPAHAEVLALGQPARDVILNWGGGCALLRDGSVRCWSRPAADTGEADGGPIRMLRVVTTPTDAIGFAPAPATATAVCVDRASKPPACWSGGGTDAMVATNPALVGASGLVMARASGAPLCAWFRNGRVACAEPGVSGLGGAPMAVPDEWRAQRLTAPWDGGFCGRGTAPSLALHCVGDETPLRTAAPTSATALAIGDLHACAIADGAIRCWGSASRGQLGAGGSYLHARPVRVPGVTDAVQFDASTVQACALRRTGAAVCWGQSLDESAKLESRFAPRAVELPSDTQALSAAGLSSRDRGRVQPMCVRRTASKGWTCLSSHGWQPTHGPEAPADSLPGVKLRQLSRDGRCGIDTQGHLVCAQASAVGTTHARAAPPTPIASRQRFVEAASGLFDGPHAAVCGRTVEGRVACFHVDDGPGAEPLAAPSLAALTGVTQLAAAGHGDDSVACALTAAGAVSCWGDGRFGQLGSAPPPSRLQAVSIGGLPAVVEIAVGGLFVCARTAGGEIYCWGSNRDGTTPDGAPGTSAVPLAVPWPADPVSDNR